MALGEHFTRAGRGLAIGTAVLAAVGFATVPRPADAVDAGAAVGIGLGALAVGAALGSTANHPSNNAYSYPNGYYYPTAPAYTAPVYSPTGAQAYYPTTPGYYPT